jgi:MYXO-CTERM domain-containing protein
MALKMWLTSNGYVVTDAAAQIIDAYVKENKFFVALKLLNGVGVSSIQPLVLKFYGNEPCIPLRLTAIAANPDMPVRVWVLADGRVVPKTFAEVKVDEARIDWTSGGANYASLTKSLLGEAADEAGGKAFVTEYAGPASIGAGLLWSEGRFDLTALKAAQTPPAYLQALIGLGLASNTQVMPLLKMYIPMPSAVQAMGVTDAQFYGNISTYWAQYAFPPFDLATLTAKITTNVIAPLQKAQAMIDAHPYLTRMNTFISPGEMDEDAFFFSNTGLGDVPLLHTATFRTMCGDRKFMACNAPIRLELADGRMAWVRSGSTSTTCTYRAPDLSGLAKLPAAEMAWMRDPVGPGTVKIDNTKAIQDGLAAYNSAFPAEQNMFPSPTGGGGMLTSSGGGGCSCGIGGGAAGGVGAGLAVLAVAGVATRRRRVRRGR